MARAAILTALALAVCVSILICAAEASKKERSKTKWMKKKAFFKSLSVSGDYDKTVDKKERKSHMPEINGNMLGLGDSGSEKRLLKKKWNSLGGKHRHGKHLNKFRSKKTKMNKHKKFQHADKLAKLPPWSDYIRPETECVSKCHKHEVCILGPMEMKSHCIHFKNLKKSMKKFRMFKKSELKAWRKYKKKSERFFKQKDIFGSKGEKSKFDNAAPEKAKLDMEKEIMQKREELLNADNRKDSPAFSFAPTEAGDPKEEMKATAEKQPECSSKDLLQMRTRIMGWFHLLRSHNKLAIREEKRLKAHKHSVKKQLDAGEKCECMKSAMWEFHQLDGDEDDFLTDKEMAILENNNMEPCMMPYLTSCDLDADGSLSSGEWCCCFSNVLGPCYRKMDEIRRSSKPVTYMPRCDKEGYYMEEQCERVDDDNFECWCVDFNGNVVEGSKTSGRALCSQKE